MSVRTLEEDELHVENTEVDSFLRQPYLSSQVQGFFWFFLVFFLLLFLQRAYLAGQI